MKVNALAKDVLLAAITHVSDARTWKSQINSFLKYPYFRPHVEILNPSYDAASRGRGHDFFLTNAFCYNRIMARFCLRANNWVYMFNGFN